MDPQTHATLQKLDPASRQEYIDRLQARQRQMLQRHQAAAFQARPGHPGAQPGIRQQHIIYRGQMPQGLTQQQQMQWIQQQTARQGAVRQGAPGLSPITQPNVVPPGSPMNQFPVDPNVSPQQQQRIQLERQQQQHRLIQMQLQREQAQKGVPGPAQQGQAISPRGAGGFPPDVVGDGTATIVQQTIVGPPGPGQPQDPNVPPGSQQT